MDDGQNKTSFVAAIYSPEAKSMGLWNEESRIPLCQACSSNSSSKENGNSARATAGNARAFIGVEVPASIAPYLLVIVSLNGRHLRLLERDAVEPVEEM